MRKQKSVVAILLAVMMIFTFMPTMAFAQSEHHGDSTYVNWDKSAFSYVEVTDSASGETTTYRDIHYSADSYGLIKAEAYLNGQPVGYDAYFYDLKGAKLYNNGEVKGSWTHDEYTKLYTTYKTNWKVLLAKPDYIATSAWNVTNAVDLADVTIKTKGEPAETTTAGEKKIIEVSFTRYYDADGTYEAPFLVGAVPTAEITIQDGSAALSNKWYVDTLDKAGVAKLITDEGQHYGVVKYDGVQHTIKYDAGNFTVSYEKRNTERGTWETVDAPVVKNVKDYGTYRAVYKNKAGKNVYKPSSDGMVIGVIPDTNLANYNAKAVFEFGKSNNKNRYEVTEEQAAKPEAFVQLIAKKYAESDAEELMKFFNDFYKITVVKGAANPNLQTWTIEEKYTSAQKTGDEYKALYKSYETLLRNYYMWADTTPRHDGFKVMFGIGSRDSMDVTVVKADDINTKADDITFSGVTTKSFKAKKKTKKLAKAKTFQVVAKADSGNVITFSATSSNGKVSIDETGVVTVKKNLKKGAKVKLVVKAKTAAGNGYKAASAEKTYIIKIK
jgi:hypothetical protein